MEQTTVAAPSETVAEFIAAINKHDLAALAKLMTDDHEFVDSLGTSVSGRTLVAGTWKALFRMVSDYWIKVDETLAQGDTVLLIGTLGGTYAGAGTPAAGARWQTPAAVRAVIRDGRVARWQVYADHEPVRQVMAQG